MYLDAIPYALKTSWNVALKKEFSIKVIGIDEDVFDRNAILSLCNKASFAK